MYIFIQYSQYNLAYWLSDSACMTNCPCIPVPDKLPTLFRILDRTITAYIVNSINNGLEQIVGIRVKNLKQIYNYW